MRISFLLFSCILPDDADDSRFMMRGCTLMKREMGRDDDAADGDGCPTPEEVFAARSAADATRGGAYKHTRAHHQRHARTSFLTSFYF